MLLDLIKILSEDGGVLERSIPVEMNQLKLGADVFPILQAEPLQLKICNTGKKVLEITAVGRVTVEIPCGRCLKPVKQEVSFRSEFVIDRKKTDRELEEEAQDVSFLKDTVLDTEKLAAGELLVHWPIRVLCKEDCKGICSRCGADLNIAPCECDREVPDPRMAAIQDIFSKFKEEV